MRRKPRLCRPRRRAVAKFQFDNVKLIPAFPHPPEAWVELLAEFREIFRLPLKPKLVEPPKADA
jgi:hypothetical protein